MSFEAAVHAKALLDLPLEARVPGVRLDAKVVVLGIRTRLRRGASAREKEGGPRVLRFALPSCQREAPHAEERPKGCASKHEVSSLRWLRIRDLLRTRMA